MTKEPTSILEQMAKEVIIEAFKLLLEDEDKMKYFELNIPVVERLIERGQKEIMQKFYEWLQWYEEHHTITR
jgi:hypothetical protein